MELSDEHEDGTRNAERTLLQLGPKKKGLPARVCCYLESAGRLCAIDDDFDALDLLQPLLDHRRQRLVVTLRAAHQYPPPQPTGDDPLSPRNNPEP